MTFTNSLQCHGATTRFDNIDTIIAEKRTSISPPAMVVAQIAIR